MFLCVFFLQKMSNIMRSKVHILTELIFKEVKINLVDQCLFGSVSVCVCSILCVIFVGKCVVMIRVHIS